LEVVLGGSGFLLVGFGVGVGVDPSSQRSPMHVMMYVWRGTRACSNSDVIHTADETARSVDRMIDRVISCMMIVFGRDQDV
jgi:hypothetical protein